MDAPLAAFIEARDSQNRFLLDPRMPVQTSLHQ